MNIKSSWHFLLGGLLVLLGVAALLDSLNVIPFGGVLWGALFGLGGLAFILYLIQNKTAWWAIIPGVILIGLSVIIVVSSLFPNFEGEIGGFILFFSISTAFWVVYVMNNKFWWAIIPGGVMAALALTILVGELTTFDGGGIFLFGIALTFLLLTILPGMEGNRQWPFIPAGILFVISLFAFFEDFNMSSLIWAFILIVFGGFLVVRSLLQNKS
jgi:hypothetical protein